MVPLPSMVPKKASPLRTWIKKLVTSDKPNVLIFKTQAPKKRRTKKAPASPSKQDAKQPASKPASKSDTKKASSKPAPDTKKASSEPASPSKPVAKPPASPSKPPASPSKPVAKPPASSVAKPPTSPVAKPPASPSKNTSDDDRAPDDDKYLPDPLSDSSESIHDDCSDDWRRAGDEDLWRKRRASSAKKGGSSKRAKH